MPNSFLKLVFIFLLFLNINVFAQSTPSYKEVVSEYFSKYSWNDFESFIKFQKKKDGWYIVEVRFDEQDKYFNGNLFWSAESNSYKPLPHPTAETDTASLEVKIANYSSLVDFSTNEYFYNRNLYYGYPGWDWDVINNLESKEKDLTDTLYESLARAYSNYAMGFFSNQYGDLFINNDVDRIKLEDKIPISKSRINKFSLFGIKAISTYKKLLEINPNYETRVGNIKIKLANEYLYMYSSLIMANETVNAKDFLKDVIYPDSILLASKNYFRNVSKNGILFTGGDNDTYPLWYLQLTQNFRSDVTVLNSSLLGLKRYLMALERQYKRTLFQMSCNKILSPNFFVFYYDKAEKENKPIPVSNFINNLVNYKSKDNKVTYNEKGEMHISIESPQEELQQIKYFNNKLIFNSPYLKNKPITLRSYLFINELAIIDIVNKNIINKSVFFTYQEQIFSTILKEKGTLYYLNK